MTMWFALAAGLAVVWLGLALFCAEAFMGGGARRRARRASLSSREVAPTHTPVPVHRVAE